MHRETMEQIKVKKDTNTQLLEWEHINLNNVQMLSSPLGILSLSNSLSLTISVFDHIPLRHSLRNTVSSFPLDTLS